MELKQERGNRMSKKTAVYGMLIALAFLLSYVETLIPFSFPIPGIKLGLANLVVLVALYSLGIRGAFAVSMVRILLSGLTFSSLSVMLYSLSGGLLSFFVMAAVRHSASFSITGVSVLGGVAHNLGQLSVAVWVVKSPALLFYLPALLIAGTVAGALIGLLGGLVTERIRPFLRLEHGADSLGEKTD
ncbi:MAG: Gx transporter family protein [Lachnospiraceae bacterium]|nr:Gx transporter family protein [Lachnospiraceae bacterium]